MIVGICGLIGSGKGTVADILVENHGFKKIAFADRVKDGLATLFSWPRDLLEGDTDRSRLWREKPDEFWSNELGKEITPRLLMQLFGTDCMRNGFNDNIWVNIVKQQLLADPDTHWVIPDARFANEVQMIKNMKGSVWQIRRGPLPVWWDTAIKTNTVDPDQEWILYDTQEHMETGYPEIHQSEWRWVDTDDAFGTIIENTTLEDLSVQVKNLVKDLR